MRGFQELPQNRIHRPAGEETSKFGRRVITGLCAKKYFFFLVKIVFELIHQF